MRADRLPDLVNNKHIGSGKAAETIVSVTFDLTDLGDLDVSNSLHIQGAGDGGTIIDANYIDRK